MIGPFFVFPFPASSGFNSFFFSVSRALCGARRISLESKAKRIAKAEGDVQMEAPCESANGNHSTSFVHVSCARRAEGGFRERRGGGRTFHLIFLWDSIFVSSYVYGGLFFIPHLRAPTKSCSSQCPLRPAESPKGRRFVAKSTWDKELSYFYSYTKGNLESTHQILAKDRREEANCKGPPAGARGWSGFHKRFCVSIGSRRPFSSIEWSR